MQVRVTARFTRPEGEGPNPTLKAINAHPQLHIPSMFNNIRNEERAASAAGRNRWTDSNHAKPRRRSVLIVGGYPPLFGVAGFGVRGLACALYGWIEGLSLDDSFHVHIDELSIGISGECLVVVEPGVFVLS